MVNHTEFYQQHRLLQNPSQKLFRILAVTLFLTLTACATSGTEARLKNPTAKGPISDTFRKNDTKLNECITESVSLNGGENMQMILTFTISPSGKALRTEIERMSTPDPDFGDCILRKVRKMEFPKPKDGQPHDVRYPLIFDQAAG